MVVKFGKWDTLRHQLFITLIYEHPLEWENIVCHFIRPLVQDVTYGLILSFLHLNTKLIFIENMLCQ